MLGDLLLSRRAFNYLLGHILIHTAWGCVGCSGHLHDGGSALLCIALHDAVHLLLSISVWVTCRLRSAPSVRCLPSARYFALEDSFARRSLSTTLDAFLGDALLSRRAFNYLLGDTVVPAA